MPRPRTDFRKALALLRLLNERGGRVPLRVVYEDIGLSQTELKKLLSQLNMSGLHPYTPDVLFEILTVGGEVVIERSPLNVSFVFQFNSEELLALLIALDFVDEVTCRRVYHDIVEKVRRSVPEVLRETAALYSERFAVVSSVAGQNVIAESILEAVEENRVVELSYVPLTASSERHYRVWPLEVGLEYHHFYLWVYDERDGEVKSFLCERITGVRPTEDRFTVTPEIAAELSRLKEERFEQERKEETAVLHYRGRAARYLSEQVRANEPQWLDSDTLVIEVPILSLDWLLRRWVLPYIDEVKIVSPAWLKKKAVERLKEMLEVMKK